jgi:hypothetical protein
VPVVDHPGLAVLLGAVSLDEDVCIVLMIHALTLSADADISDEETRVDLRGVTTS